MEKRKKGALCIGEGPEYRPFCNFRSVPRRVCRRNRLKIAEGLYWGPFLKYSRAGIFSLFRNSDRLAGTFHWSKESSTVEPGWYLPPRKIPLAENRFLQAGNGAENTKEKSRQCFYVFFQTPLMFIWLRNLYYTIFSNYNFINNFSSRHQGRGADTPKFNLHVIGRAKKGCEFNQKRCELKNFLIIIENFPIYSIRLPNSWRSWSLRGTDVQRTDVSSLEICARN